MVSSSQIKACLALYLANRISLGQFEDWFVPNTRDIRRTRSEAAMSLTFAIEGVLSEYLSRVLDDRELHIELQMILHAGNTILEIDRPKPPFVSISSSDVVWERPIDSTGRPPISEVSLASSPVALVPVEV